MSGPSRAPRLSWTFLPLLDDPPATILEWLCVRFPRIGAARWLSRLERGLVIDGDGGTIEPAAPYLGGIRVGYYREVDDEPLPTEEVHLLHMDDHLVVADKPHFVPVTPGGAIVRGCLLYRVEQQLGLTGLVPVHRLDRMTAGLVLFARRPEERGAYAGVFARREVRRTYVARSRVPVAPRQRGWTVASRIEPGEPFFRMREVSGPPNATTDVELEEVVDGWGRFLLRPDTGKKHQLRLHMASLGWPIAGDRLYPELLEERPDDMVPPLSLVARRLELRDPVTAERRCFVSRLDLPTACRCTEPGER